MRSASITRILAAVALIPLGFVASSCERDESYVYGSWRATRDGEVQTLDLQEDHTYRFVVESDRADDVITMTGTWRWVTIDGHGIDLFDCDERKLGGKDVPGITTYNHCFYSLVTDGFLIGPKILAGWNGAPDLRR